jgi:hypothetical protein
VIFFGFSTVNNGISRDGRLLSSTIKSDNFHRYLLSRAYKRPPHGTAWSVLPQTPQTVDEEDEYIKVLQEIASTPGWFDGAASLGKPFPMPMYCWFTSTDALHKCFLACDSTETKGTRTRDVLGLIDGKAGECRLEIQFLASSLENVGGVIIARPSFADRGNTRFAAVQNGRRPRLYHALGWGTTVDLRKVAEGNPDIEGLPERVCSALPPLFRPVPLPNSYRVSS